MEAKTAIGADNDTNKPEVGVGGGRKPEIFMNGVSLTEAPKDIFDESEEDMDSPKIDLRVQSRAKGRFITLVQGLRDRDRPREIANAFKRHLQCGASLSTHIKFGDVIILCGDHRIRIAQYFYSKGFDKSRVVIHG